MTILNQGPTVFQSALGSARLDIGGLAHAATEMCVLHNSLSTSGIAVERAGHHLSALLPQFTDAEPDMSAITESMRSAAEELAVLEQSSPAAYSQATGWAVLRFQALIPDHDAGAAKTSVAMDKRTAFSEIRNALYSSTEGTTFIASNAFRAAMDTYGMFFSHKLRLRLSQIGGRPVMFRGPPAMPSLVHPEPLRLARFPQNAPLEKSVILHPREAGRFIKGACEIVELEGRVRGRTIYVRSPDSDDVLNFKGTGADFPGRGELIIDGNYAPAGGQPMDRWEFESRYRRNHVRIWGAVEYDEANGEFEEARKLMSLGLPVTPYIENNPVTPFNLNQLVRKMGTTIRISEIEYIRDDVQFRLSETLVKSLARFDVQWILFCLGRVSEGGTVLFDGVVEQNRYVDGLITDAENFKLKGFDGLERALAFPDGCVNSSIHLLTFTRQDLMGLYWDELITGLSSSPFWPSEIDVHMRRSHRDFDYRARSYPGQQGEDGVLLGYDFRPALRSAFESAVSACDEKYPGRIYFR